MAMPVLTGEKTEAERFPGAVATYCIEAMMQDRKALQAGTSHFLGQNFAKASDIKFLDENGQLVHAWTTSWGVSTRLIGGLIMTHSDDDGFIVPPKLAPAQVVIIPITFKAKDPQKVTDYCRSLRNELRSLPYGGGRVEVELDERDMRGGDKLWSWIKKGVPIRLEVGERDIVDDSVFMARRDRSAKEKAAVKRGEFVATIVDTLDDIQKTLFDRAASFRAQHTKTIDSKDDFYAFFTAPGSAPGGAVGRQNDGESEEDFGDDSGGGAASGGPSGGHGGFALTHWCGDPAIEKQINDELGVTIRLIPFGEGEAGTCPFTGKPSPKRVVWAKSY